MEMLEEIILNSSPSVSATVLEEFNSRLYANGPEVVGLNFGKRNAGVRYLKSHLSEMPVDERQIGQIVISEWPNNTSLVKVYFRTSIVENRELVESWWAQIKAMLEENAFIAPEESDARKDVDESTESKSQDSDEQEASIQAIMAERPWDDIEDNGYDRLFVKMLWEGSTTPEIVLRLKQEEGTVLTAKTINNRFSILRKKYRKLVPTREVLRKRGIY